jgi:Cu(I)/Ag(I) efflux system membrane fusion protein/cobalt-zinc-cadmium efflux system membrane fusion protein
MKKDNDSQELKMKTKSIIIFVLGILIGAAGTYFVIPEVSILHTKPQKEVEQLYSCGMHPEVISDEPGNCPICGMKLTPIKSTNQNTQKGVPPDSAEKSKILYWRAPMDPTEIYEEPGKSKMGMDLVHVYEGEEAGGAGRITIDGVVQQNMNLRIAPVKRRDIYNVIRAYGRVSYAEDQQFTVTTKISGWIEKLYVNTKGQKVHKGQPLLEIYSPELVSTQEEYLLALENDQKLSSSSFESVRNNAQKMLSLARERLEYWDVPETEIAKIKESRQTRRTILLKSQVTGVVTHKAVKEGDKIGPGMDLFYIASLDKIWVEAAVYESEIPLIKVGQKAELELDHITEEKRAGKVDFIYPYLDQKSKANTVRLVFDNHDQVLKPDMYATVRIYTQAAKDAMAVPSEAVIHSGKRQIVFVTQGDGKFEPREIKVGAESDDGYVQVISGLFDHEEVVVSGQFLLDSESRTREAIAKMRETQVKKVEETVVEKQKQEPEPHQNEKVDMEAAQLYACPMHPDFLTTDKDARCPECVMKLEKVK